MSQVSYGTITINDITDIKDMFLQYCMVANNITVDNITESSWFILSDDTIVKDKYYYILNNLDGKYYIITPIGSENPSSLGWYEDNPYPNWQSGYQIWIREVKIKQGIDLPEYGTPYLDTAVNQINNSYISLNAKVKNYWWDSTGAHIASGIDGADVSQNDITTYGFNSLVELSSIKFRYNAIPLLEMGLLPNNFNGIKLYNPILTGSVITSSSLDATLTSEGLKLLRGGIDAGEYSSTTTNFIYLSTEDYNRTPAITIGNNSSGWRQIIGSKFGVKNDGTLYASNVNIEGAITATSLTIGNGSSSYNGIAAMNINGYSIEIIIDSTDVVDTATSTYLYPQLYHNGSKVDYFLSTDTNVDLSKTYYTRSGTAGNYTYTAVTNPSGNPSVNQYYEHIDYSHFLWYRDNETIGTAGDVNHYGRCLGIYGHTYRVIYEFDDGEVGGSAEVQTRLVDPSKYITKINDTGITIHPEVWESSSSYLQLNGNGLYIKDLNDEELAHFIANGVQIGKTGESHIEMDYHSMQLIDKEGNAYFYVSDLRSNHTAADEYGEGFYAVITDTFTGDGSQTDFILSNISLTNNYKVYVNGVEESTTSKHGGGFTFATAPAAGSIVTATYPTAAQTLKAYTAGLRGNGEIGSLSFAEGYHTTASGSASHAEGYHTTASGSASHAEGIATIASGDYAHAEGRLVTASGYTSHAEGTYTTASGRHSHAEGWYTTASASGSHAEGEDTTASGTGSHAQNFRTIAGHSYQTVIGKCNDNQSTNAFEIGNGGDDQHRSNALTVDWSGNIQMALDTTASSGTDYDLYTAISTLGWASTVIE